MKFKVHAIVTVDADRHGQAAAIARQQLMAGEVPLMLFEIDPKTGLAKNAGLPYVWDPSLEQKAGRS